MCLAFSQTDVPLLATGDHEGNINFWDLNEKQIFSMLKQAHNVYIFKLGKSIKSKLYEK